MQVKDGVEMIIFVFGERIKEEFRNYEWKGDFLLYVFIYLFYVNILFFRVYKKYLYF